MAAVAEQLADRWAVGGDVDLDAECRDLTLRALGRSVLGIDLTGRTEMVGPALRDGVKWAADRAVRPVNPPRWWPTPAQRRARGANRTLHGLASEILQACRADPTREAPLVRALMQATDPQTGECLTDNAICDELVLFLVAGHDTTATALTYALWALGHRPGLQKRIVDEVDQPGSRQLTHEDVPRLGYTMQVWQEALRICPPVPVVARMVMQDIEVDGYLVKAGSFAIVAIHAIHHDPALWADPLAFDPDRFRPQQSNGRDRWQYLPFGGGPQACIGHHFASQEAILALASIIRRAEIRSLSGDFPVVTPLTATAVSPIPARVGPRRHPGDQQCLPTRLPCDGGLAATVQ
jgi:cytochrome P450